MGLRNRPGYTQGFARNITQAAHPRLWERLRFYFDASLGPQAPGFVQDLSTYRARVTDVTVVGANPVWTWSYYDKESEVLAFATGAGTALPYLKYQPLIKDSWNRFTLHVRGSRAATGNVGGSGLLGGYGPLVGQGNSTHLVALEWWFDGVIYFEIGSGVGADGHFTPTAPADTAHDIHVVYDGTGATNADRLKIWFDGQQQTLGFTGTIPATLPAGVEGYPFTLGWLEAYNKSTDGWFSRVAVYDRTFNQSDVALSIAHSPLELRQKVLGKGPSGSVASGVTLGSTVSLVAGSASGGATAPGATLGVTVSLIPGTATGGRTVSGVTFGVGVSLIPGTASGGITKAGVTFGVTVSLIPGTASATTSATASGTTFGVIVGLIAGSASGGGTISGANFGVVVSLIPGTATAAATASGTTFGVAVSLIPGSATAAATALGTTFGVAVSLIPGAATGLAAGTAPGTTFGVTVSLIPGIATGYIAPAIPIGGGGGGDRTRGRGDVEWLPGGKILCEPEEAALEECAPLPFEAFTPEVIPTPLRTRTPGVSPEEFAALREEAARLAAQIADGVRTSATEAARANRRAREEAMVLRFLASLDQVEEET